MRAGRTGQVAAGGELLERAHHLATLHEALAAVGTGRGGILVLLAGEAGGGKTALLRRFRADCEPVERVLWGSCDPLFTPRPLGPFLDIAHEAGGELRDLVAAGAEPHQIAAAVAAVCRAGRRAMVVLEDLHWADEATLDVLSLLGRRIETIPALLIATYRDDELDRTHPLRRFLGELRGVSAVLGESRGAPPVRRLTAEPLSRDAVAALAAPHGLDAEELYRATAGNPFFVAEVIAAPEAGIPATVRDAVLARTARLSEAATTVAGAVSIAVPQAELWLLDALVAATHDAAGDPARPAGDPTLPGGGPAAPAGAPHGSGPSGPAVDLSGALDECLSAGIVEVGPAGVAFRHELARMAVEESLSPHCRMALHRRALRALSTPPAGPPDLARLAYHAEAAGDAEGVLRYAPAAARHAASTGAHREAAAQYDRALRFGAGLPPDTHADLLERRSYECFLTDDTVASVDALRQAIAYRRAAGDSLAEAAALSQLARRLGCGGHTLDSAEAAHAAVRLLEGRPPGRELAQATGVLSSVHLDDERFDETISSATRALDLAEACGDTEVTVYCLNNIGTMQLLAGMPDGRRRLERSLALAEAAGLDEPVGRAYIHLGWAMTRTRAYDLEPWLERGVRACEELGLDAWKLYVIAYRARAHLDRGRWNRAAADASYVLRCARSVPLLRLLALSVLGLLRARRGDAGQWPALDDALALQEGQVELQYRAPVTMARAEAAWLSGRGREVEAITGDLLDAAADRRAVWIVGELAWLRRLAGITQSVPGPIEPYSTQLAGDAAGAADRWIKLGCPYDAALALVDSDDEGDLRRALAEFQRLGARPAAGIVARRLREFGVRDLPRGPRPDTEHHPARLTRREAEVLAHLQQGASNAEIATRLYLSEKTVQHHVSAILRKLGVTSRGQAAFAAVQRGLTADARPSP